NTWALSSKRSRIAISLKARDQGWPTSTKVKSPTLKNRGLGTQNRLGDYVWATRPGLCGQGKSKDHCRNVSAGRSSEGISAGRGGQGAFPRRLDDVMARKKQKESGPFLL